MGRIKLRELKISVRPYQNGPRDLPYRCVYEQLDGNVILADDCTCAKDPFTCPIDKHSMAARMHELREGWD
jgi:hypothetical protein